MASQQPNVWQTANRSRNSNANSTNSRTPQSRSATQSPSQQPDPSQLSKPDSTRAQQPPQNVWAQRSNAVSSSSNGASRAQTPSQLAGIFQSFNGFNAAEVSSFLSRDVDTVEAYKVVGLVDDPVVRGGGGAASGNDNLASGQSFFLQLAKQVATADGGG